MALLPPNKPTLRVRATLPRRFSACAAIVLSFVMMPAAVALENSTGRPAFVVIVNRQNPMNHMSRESLADMFFKRASHWDDGWTVQPADQCVDSAVRNAFSDDVLRRAVGAVRSYWQQRIFSGRDVPPPELESDEAVVRFVAKYRGAVGYVSTGAKLGETKVLALQ